MSDDLVNRLRDGVIEHRRRWSGDTHDDLGGSVDCEKTDALMGAAADRIEKLEAEVARLRDALGGVVKYFDARHRSWATAHGRDPDDYKSSYSAASGIIRRLTPAARVDLGDQHPPGAD